MMAGSVGPIDAVVIDVIHPALRATAASILSLTQNLFGLAGGPLLTGVLSDAYGLQFALSVVPAVLPARRRRVRARRAHLRSGSASSVDGVEPALDARTRRRNPPDR